MGSEKLAPCPFCGGTDTSISDIGVFWVVCNSCDAEGPYRDSEYDAVTTWNTRAHAQGRQQSVWLVEWSEDDNVPVRWWNPSTGWMRDANKALWFARESDAADYIAAGKWCAVVRPTEHIFMSAIRAPEAADAGAMAKPLEWKEWGRTHGGFPNWAAECAVGIYEVEMDVPYIFATHVHIGTGGSWSRETRTQIWRFNAGTPRIWAQGFADAKAAAQGHYSSLILGALAASPATDSGMRERAALFDEIEAFARATNPYGYRSENEAIRLFLAAARDHLALPSTDGKSATDGGSERMADAIRDGIFRRQPR